MLNRIKTKLGVKNNADKVSFWFIRHGQSESNVLGSECLVMNDAPLTERGTDEARSMARYFKENNINVTDVYTSPLGRSHQTAEVIAKELGLSVKVKDGLKERDWGIWRDLPWDEVANKLSGMDINERYSFVPENGESWQQMERRLFDVLEEIAEENSAGENILIVTHRGCLRAILPVLAKASHDKHEDFSVETGSLTKFSFDKESFEFVGLVPYTQSKNEQ
ncbi:MAG: histidine phosphatase family protein [Candidatus Yanofskybacteria bacterium]|nr:histidine phosphatase family protein [Candidatus Yanofskybacteria bacterium]